MSKILEHGRMLLAAKGCPVRHSGEDPPQALWAEFGDVGWRMALDAAIQVHRATVGEHLGMACSLQPARTRLAVTGGAFVVVEATTGLHFLIQRKPDRVRHRIVKL